jgi:hypothetical protein
VAHWSPLRYPRNIGASGLSHDWFQCQERHGAALPLCWSRSPSTPALDHLRPVTAFPPYLFHATFVLPLHVRRIITAWAQQTYCSVIAASLHAHWLVGAIPSVRYLHLHTAHRRGPGRSTPCWKPPAMAGKEGAHASLILVKNRASRLRKWDNWSISPTSGAIELSTSHRSSAPTMPSLTL